MVSLDDFVAESLTQLVRGIRRAQEGANADGGRIIPQMQSLFPGRESAAEGFGWAKDGNGVPVFLVEFDVAVTASEGSGTKGGLGVVMGAVAIGGQARAEESTSAVSRLRFRVPILFPAHLNIGTTKPGEA